MPGLFDDMLGTATPSQTPRSQAPSTGLFSDILSGQPVETPAVSPTGPPRIEEVAPPVAPNPDERLSTLQVMNRGFTQNLVGTYELLTAALPGLVNQMAGRPEEAARLYGIYEEAQKKLTEANQRGQVPTELEGINSPSDAFRYFLYQMGYGTGEIATMAISALAGGGIGGLAARGGAALAGRELAAGAARGVAVRGAESAALAQGFARNIGESGAGVYGAGGQDENAAWVAAGAGVAKGLLDAAPFMRLMGRSGITREVLEAGISRSILKRMGREVALNMPIEGITEGAQELIDAAVESAYKEGFWTPETVSRFANSAAAGALMGVPGGAITGALQGRNATPGRETGNVTPPPSEPFATNEIETPDQARRFLSWRGVRLPDNATDETILSLGKRENEAWLKDLYDRQDAGDLNTATSEPRDVYSHLINKGVDTNAFTFKDVLEAYDVDTENKHAVDVLRKNFNNSVENGYFTPGQGRNKRTYSIRRFDKSTGDQVETPGVAPTEANSQEGKQKTLRNLLELRQGLNQEDPRYEQLSAQIQELQDDIKPFSKFTEEQLAANQLLSVLSSPEQDQQGTLDTLLETVKKLPEAKRIKKFIKQITSEENDLNTKLSTLDPSSPEAIELRSQKVALRDRLEGLRDGTFVGGPQGNVASSSGGRTDDIGTIARASPEEVNRARDQEWIALQEKTKAEEARSLQDYKDLLANTSARGLAMNFLFGAKRSPSPGQNFRNYLDFSDFAQLHADKKNALVERMKEAGYVDEEGKWVGPWDHAQSSAQQTVEAAQATRAQPSPPAQEPLRTPLPENFDQTLSIPPGARDYITALPEGATVSVSELQARWKQEARRTVTLNEVKAFLKDLTEGPNKGIVRRIGDRWIRGPVAEWPAGWSQRGQEALESDLSPSFQRTSSPQADLGPSRAVELLNRMLKGTGVDVQFKADLKAGDFPLLVQHMVDRFGIPRESAEAISLAGLWNKDKNLIRLSLEGTKNIESTAFHEGVHALEDLGYLNQEDMKLLEQAFPAAQKWFEVNYGDADWASLPAKEKRAYAAEMLKETPSSSLGQKIQSFFTRLGNWLRGLGYRTVEDLTRDMESGNIASRAVNLRMWPSEAHHTPDPAFMRDSKPVMENVEYLKKNQPSFAMWRQWVNTTSHLAEKYPILKPLQQLFDRARALHSELMNTSYVAASKFMQFTPERRAYLTRLMASFEEAKQDPVVHNGTIAINGLTTSDPTEVEAIMSLHNQHVRLWDSAVAALTKNVYGVDPTDVEASKNPAFRAAKSYYDKLSKTRVPGYIPHIRIGSQYAAIKNKDGKTVEYVAFDKKGKGAKTDPELRVLKYLNEKYPGQKIEVGDRTIDQERKELLQSASMMEQFIQLMADQDNIRLNNQADAAVQELIKKLTTQKELAFTNAFQRHRKNIPGWLLPWNGDTYFQDALPRYYNGAAKAIVRLNINRAYNNIVAGYHDPVTKTHVNGLQDVNPKMASYARELYNHVMSPANNWASSLKSLAFHWQLGFAMDSAVVNMMQLPTTTIPYMSMFTNPLSATAHVVKAYTKGLVAASTMDPSKGFVDYHRLVETFAKGDEALGNHLRFLAETGILSPIYGDEIRKQVDLSKYGYSRDLEGKINKVVEFSSSFFSFAEQMNRIATAVATYEMLKNQKSLEKFNAYHDAKGWTVDPQFYTDPMAKAMAESVARTQFTGAEYDKPLITRKTPFLQVFTQFMPVMIKLTESYWKNAVDMRHAEPAVRIAAARQLLFQTIAIAGIAGMMGVPFAPMMGMLYDLARFLISGGIKHDLEGDIRDFLMAHTNPTFARFLTKGAPFVAGIDVSQRADMNIIRPQQLANFSLENAFGPAGASILNPFMNLIQAHKEGRNEWWHLAAAVAPRALGNTLRGYGYTQEGIRTGAGATVVAPEQVNAGMAGLRATGFTSTPEAEAKALGQDVRFMNSRNQWAKEAASEELAKMLADVMREQDPAKQEALKDRYRDRMRMYAREDRAQEDPSMRLYLNSSAIAKRAQEMITGQQRQLAQRLERPLRRETLQQLQQRYQ